MNYTRFDNYIQGLSPLRGFKSMYEHVSTCPCKLILPSCSLYKISHFSLVVHAHSCLRFLPCRLLWQFVVMEQRANITFCFKTGKTATQTSSQTLSNAYIWVTPWMSLSGCLATTNTASARSNIQKHFSSGMISCIWSLRLFNEAVLNPSINSIDSK
jgi:hypothetical protein